MKEIIKDRLKELERQYELELKKGSENFMSAKGHYLYGSINTLKWILEHWIE